jgi:hypothetical protein
MGRLSGGPWRQGGGGDLNGRLGRGLQLGGRPWLEAAGVAAEPVGPGGGGEDHTGRREQGAAGSVEVVAVVVVAEQDRVDWAEVGGGDRRAGQLSGAGAPAEAVAPPAHLEQAVGPPMWVLRTVMRRRLALADRCPRGRG